jgi:hypothetical protein
VSYWKGWRRDDYAVNHKGVVGLCAGKDCPQKGQQYVAKWTLVGTMRSRRSYCDHCKEQLLKR